MSPAPPPRDRILEDGRLLEDRVTASGEAAASDVALGHGPKLAQAGSVAGERAAGPVDTRTVYVVEGDVVRKLPDRARSRAVAEVRDVFAFVGARRGQTAMSVSLLAPERLPEAFSFSDAVVSVVAKAVELGAHLDGALRQQRRNAIRSIRELGFSVDSQPMLSGRSPAVPERAGIALAQKQVVAAGRQRLALPLMVAVVALDSVIADAVLDFRSKADEKAIRRRRTQGPVENPTYWGSSQALLDTQALMVFDNPEDPSVWAAAVQETLGGALGRAIAHEARHLYIPEHADDGLGGEGAPLLGARGSQRFSPADERDILARMQKLEAVQAGAILVETYPEGARDKPFPF